ncbi:MAG: hypothetical protein ACOX7D_03410 [Alphaproteobacteria bacterium]|jgi:hypothetical protein
MSEEVKKSKAGRFKNAKKGVVNLIDMFKQFGMEIPEGGLDQNVI